ncbi:MAG: hypothetical protein ACM3QS_01585 [Bacteroidota bacterium]
MMRKSLATTALVITLLITLGMGSLINGAAAPAPEQAAPALANAAGSLNVDLDQCANQTTPCSWQNGDLNGNNSSYAEGDVVPFRLAIEGLAAGSHSIHINYDFTAGGHEAYDFLATYNATETVDLCAAGGGAVSSLCPSLPAPDVQAFPSDPFVVPGTLGSLSVAGAEAASGVSRNLTMFGGTITSITPASGPVHSGSTGGNSTADFVVNFDSTGSAVLFAWGGHLASSSYWKNTDGSPDGAGQVSGAPWHMRTQNLDGSGNKNQDRSIQPSALQAPTPTPTDTPTNTPTDTPTNTPTNTPTDTPTNTPTDTPTNTPTDTPTNTPTNTPTDTPTNTPTDTPTNTPTDTPTNTPTNTPTDTPTPTNTPTNTPTDTPTPTPIPVNSQITPTGTTCTEFVSGAATTLSQLQYSVKNGLVSQVNPGVFFYWVEVDAVAGSNTYTIDQAITTGNFDSHFFSQASGSFAYAPDCTKIGSTISTSNGVTTITFNAGTPGTYVIGIKYDAGSVVGFTAPSPGTTVSYTFTLDGFQTSTKGLDLVKK